MMQDSSDSQNQQPISLLNRNGSSGAFELIQQDIQPIVLHISTINQNIILNQKLKPKKTISPQQWKQLLSLLISSHSINNYASIIYAVCHGLSPSNKIILWETTLIEDRSSILTPHLKQSNSYNEKYNKTIVECVDKLRERVYMLWKEQGELKEILEVTKEMLEGYYKEDPEIGFCKSLEYLAFGVVVALRENPGAAEQLGLEAGHYFSNLMRKKKLRDMYFPGFPGIFPRIKDLEGEIKDEMPQLYAKINTLNKQWQHLFFKHYLTAFLHKIPYKSAFTKIIQLFLVEGSQMITYVLKRILEETQKQLLKMKKDELEEHLKNTLFSNYISKYSQSQLPQCLFNLFIKVDEMGK